MPVLHTKAWYVQGLVKASRWITFCQGIPGTCCGPTDLISEPMASTSGHEAARKIIMGVESITVGTRAR